MKKIYIYKQFERFWHWTQASLIIFLALTGFEVHGSLEIFGFDQAARFHRFGSYALLVLVAFAIFWHVTTGEWKHYIPTTKNLLAQIRFYAFGMFKGQHHPTEKTELSKLNPLQRLVYLGFKIILIPLTLISGILYLYHKIINVNDVVVISDFSLKTIATWHTVGGFLLIVFLIVHVYMTTTGRTPTSNIKAMITGYEEIPEDENKQDKNTITKE